MGTNPCSEQSLESYELCTLVETFPFRAVDRQDYLRTLKFAYLYAKTVTLGKTHWPETNRVLLRNRRIGCSISGVAQFITKYGVEELRQWCEEGYKTLTGWGHLIFQLALCPSLHQDEFDQAQRYRVAPSWRYAGHPLPRVALLHPPRAPVDPQRPARRPAQRRLPHRARHLQRQHDGGGVPGRQR